MTTSGASLDTTSPPSDDGRANGPSLGTFAGVFTPSVLTILGIILFLRLGYVVGEAGLGRALVIIGIANLISVLTSISLAAVATNLRVKGGGDYYLISRTLGVAYGGALGLVLFLAQSVSIAFYAIGFGEVLVGMFDGAPAWANQAVAAAAVAALFVLAFKGADVATRFQFVVMGVLAAALLAFFVGGLGAWDGAQLERNWSVEGEVPFWVLFAIFFPAVTGFTQGVSMSGDLRDPARSLPAGTFAAVFISMAVYLAVALVFAAGLPADVLADDYGAMGRLAMGGWLVDAGVIAATLSSALASFLGAPRILQSLAQDKVFPGLVFFAQGSGPMDNPRRGVVLSAAIALATIGLGNLNAVASVVSMFFLISYGLLNYATYYEARGRSPSFRPRFRWFHERLSLAGCLACGGVMLAIQPAAAALALAVLLAVHQYLTHREGVPRWADGGRAYRLQGVRRDMLALAAEPPHPRDWRPILLAFSDDPVRRERLLRFASWIEGGAGFTTAVRLIEGEGAVARRRATEAEDELRADIRKRGLEAFALALAVPDIEDAVPILVRSHGLGPVRANTVLLNWFDGVPAASDVGLRSYGRPLRLALRNGCNVVVLEASTEELERFDATRPRDRRIDVWALDEATGGLSLMLAYLMTRSNDWEEARIRYFVPRPSDVSAEEATEGVRRTLDGWRITAEPQVVDTVDRDTIVARSRGVSLVFLPFRIRDDMPLGPFDGPLEALCEELEITALVRAAETIDLEAEPESGAYAEVSAALDRAQQTAERARRTEKDAERAAKEAARAREELEAAGEADAGDDDRAEREAQLAEEEAERVRRRALKARAVADEAAREAREVTGDEVDQSPPDDEEPAEAGEPADDGGTQARPGSGSTPAE